MRFATREYESNHGRAPRGHGSWAFCPTRDYRDGVDYLRAARFFSGTYSEAKRAARAAFKGEPELTVCP